MGKCEIIRNGGGGFFNLSVNLYLWDMETPQEFQWKHQQELDLFSLRMKQ